MAQVPRVHEFVYLRNPDEGKSRSSKASIWTSTDAFIGRVEEIVDSHYVKIRWMYRPDDIPKEKRRSLRGSKGFDFSFDDPKHLIWSNHVDINPVETLEGTCKVLKYDEYCKLSSRRSGSGDGVGDGGDGGKVDVIIPNIVPKKKDGADEASEHVNGNSIINGNGNGKGVVGDARKDGTSDSDEENTYFFFFAYNVFLDILFPYSQVDPLSCIPSGGYQQQTRPQPNRKRKIDALAAAAGWESIDEPVEEAIGFEVFQVRNQAVQHKVAEQASKEGWKLLCVQVEILEAEKKLTKDEASQVIILASNSHGALEEAVELAVHGHKTGRSISDKFKAELVESLKYGLEKASRNAWSALSERKKSSAREPHALLSDLIVEAHLSSAYLISAKIKNRVFRGWLYDIKHVSN